MSCDNLTTKFDNTMCELRLDFEIEKGITPDSFQNIPSLHWPTYEYFFKNFLLGNWPCIIRNITDDWPASRYWVRENTPNWTYLSDTYGDSTVTVHNCKEMYFNSHKTAELTFNDYLYYWQRYRSTIIRENDLLYLKDWHLKNENPEDNFYTVPTYFASDWLNEYLVDKKKDDYRFVYMGPKGTWTPFHADVLTSYSWSVNVCGKKKWILFPPGEESKLTDALGNFFSDVSDKLSPDVQYYEVIQDPGEALFVPSGWYHQVWNLEDTISVNHNWVNGCNIASVWKSLSDNLKLVKKQIKDCEDMDNFHEHSQLMLGASYGMNFEMFLDLLHHIGLKRISMVEHNSCEMLYNDYTIDRQHAIYDLQCIKPVIDAFTEHDDFFYLFEEDKKSWELLDKVMLLEELSIPKNPDK